MPWLYVWYRMKVYNNTIKKLYSNLICPIYLLDLVFYTLVLLWSVPFDTRYILTIIEMMIFFHSAFIRLSQLMPGWA